MEKIKLCVLDEPLDKRALQSLFPVCPDIIAVKTRDNALLEPEGGFVPPLSHGTLCMQCGNNLK